MHEIPNRPDVNVSETKKVSWWKRRFAKVPVWAWILIAVAIIGYFGDDEGGNTASQAGAQTSTSPNTAPPTTLPRPSTTTTLRPTTTVRPAPTTTTTTTPDGKEWSARGDMRLRFLDRSEYQCPSGTRCLGMLVYSVKGCPRTGYIEFNLLNSNDYVVGRANDLIPRLQPNEVYRTVISTYEQGVAKFRLNEVSC